MLFKNLGKFGLCFLVICYTVLTITALCFNSGIFSLLTSFVGITAGILNSKKIKYCYIFYMIFAMMYAFLSFSNKFYGEAIFNAFYIFPMHLFSIIYYFKSKKIHSAEIKSIKKKQTVFLIFLIIIFTFIYGFLLNFINSELPFLNALNTAVCACCNYLSFKRIKEQWCFWILSTIILITIWIIAFLNGNNNSIPMIIQNMLFVIINIYGFKNWIKKTDT